MESIEESHIKENAIASFGRWEKLPINVLRVVFELIFCFSAKLDFPKKNADRTLL